MLIQPPSDNFFEVEDPDQQEDLYEGDKEPEISQIMSPSLYFVAMKS